MVTVNSVVLSNSMSADAMSAAEQYMLELINRARLDPIAEAQRYNLALNTDLDANAISSDAKQVLAPSAVLNRAAEDHSEWMLEADVFSHTGAAGSSPGDRIEDAGYEFTGAWTWRENLAWIGSTGTLDLNTAIAAHHEDLYRSEGHRLTTFASNTREVGIFQAHGEFTVGGMDYDSSMMTLNFASSGTDVFVTGVAYTDLDGDAFYSIGEGQSDVWITVDGANTTTTASGGYGLGVRAAEDLQVLVGQGGITLATLQVDASGGNVKVDVVTATDNTQSLMVSADTVLVSGIPDAVLLGSDNLTLTGNDDDNRLTGNAGNNTLKGNNGNDILQGKNGNDNLQGGNNNDKLYGGNGNDKLYGGSGRDVLKGGSGADSFVFVEGHDVIADFTDNVDLIELVTNATIAEVMAAGEIIGDTAVFNFGNGSSLTVVGVNDLSILENDFLIV